MIQEDEDVVFKDHPLDQYLREIGFQDYESATCLNEKKCQNVFGRQSFSAWIMTLWRGINVTQYFTSKLWRVNWLDGSTAHDIINIITHSKLLIPEDFHFISNFNTEAHSLQRPKYHMLSLGGTVSALSWTLGSPFAILSVPTLMLYAVKRWTCQRYRRECLVLITSFLGVLKELKSTTRKVLRHLQENELIARGFMFTVTGSSVDRLENSSLPSFAQRWHMHPGLRKGLASALTAAARCLIEATKTLQEKHPLRGHLEKQLSYLAFHENDFFEEFSSVHYGEDVRLEELKIEFLKVLQNYYLLLQSEFLQCLALIFHPDLRVENSCVKWEILLDLSSKLSEITTQLSIEYRVFSCYGLPGKEQISNTLDNMMISKLKYDKLYLSVHSTKLHLQNILHRTHAIEKYLEARENIVNDNAETMEEDLHSAFCDILKELDICKSCCEQGETLLKNLKNSEAVRNLSDDDNQAIERLIENQNVIQIHVGKTDLDPDGEDEVFEAISTAEYFADSDESFENIKSNKVEKYHDCSNLLLNELKTVLVDKAKEWKKREEKALENKRAKGCANEKGEDSNETELSKPASLGYEINNFMGELSPENNEKDKTSTDERKNIFSTPDMETVNNYVTTEKLNFSYAEDGTVASEFETSITTSDEYMQKVQMSSPFGLQAVPLTHRFMLNDTETFYGTGENSSDEDSADN